MGQKVHPIGFRLGFIHTWSSRWYAGKKDFSRFLHEDLKIRKHVFQTFLQAAIARVEIERASDKIRVNIHTARPGVIIGRKGADIDRLREDLQKMTGNKEVHINIKEVKNAATNAQLVSDNIALQLEKRIAFRRAMKKAIQQAFDSGAKGIKIQTKGRLAGSEIARAEGYLEGKVPLHTLRADIDYGFSEAQTTYGKIGVKVLIYKGEIIKRESVKPEKKEEAAETSHAVDA
ncbi:MAG: 30S ribosomal protein S3 [Omnitrophica bacterium RIFCSPHIGHO2_02_FULL_51_18]|nr:MAG: 30S ribosomal protein S3 [Omnitrophica bacterium RIFCSPHIGHO2_02_FULL_51_18]